MDTCDRKGQSYPVEYYLESVEEYSEGKIHKSEPEPGNGNVNTDCTLLIRSGEIFESIARSPGGGGGTPYNGLYGEAPPERGTFFRP